MKKLSNKFFIFITSGIIGLLISINFNMNNSSKLFKLSTKEYSDASEERNNLYNEISDLKESNYYLENKISEYYNNDDNDDNGQKVIEDMKAQLKEYSDIVGATSIKGPGIIVTITDGDYNLKEDSQYLINRRMLHNSDVASVLNEFRKLGAEAIAINSYRVLGNTGVECSWAFIRFDDKKIEAAPFNFYVIGDPEQLAAGILAEGSYMNGLIIRELKIEIEKSDEIVLLGTSKSLNPQYMQRGD